MVFDYTDYVSERHIYSSTGMLGSATTKDIEFPRSYKRFFKNISVCPSCKTAVSRVLRKTLPQNMGADCYLVVDVYECAKCGWWYGSVKTVDDRDLVDEVDTYVWHYKHFAIVKQFKTDDVNLPLTTLLQEIQSDKKIIYEIHSKKMEELAQYVFSQFYNCEVKHVGKTSDGGKDLIIVHKDDPILVQIKRRTKINSVEEVATIRDFLGTLFIENVRKGIVVSSAHHFSRASLNVRKELLNNNKLDYFELINFDEFCSMLNVYRKDSAKPWQKVLAERIWKVE